MQTVLRYLGQGSLSNSLLSLYSVNQNWEAEVHQISVVNKDTVPRTLNIYVCIRMENGQFSPNRLITPAGMILGAGHITYVLDNPVMMSNGDSFKGICDVAGVVEYTITGKEYKP